LDPITFWFSTRNAGAEVEVYRTVSILDDIVARRTIWLNSGIDKATGFVVIDGDRPELGNGRIFGNLEVISLASV